MRGWDGRGERVKLRDGTAVLVREIRPEDKDRLQEGLDRLSPESRQNRFFTPKRTLTESELEYLTEVDHRDHQALGAVTPDDEEPIGVARYIRLAEEPSTAEVAVTVLDEWQRRGVASLLLERLVEHAFANGVTCFTAWVSATNRGIIEVLSRLGHAELGPIQLGVIEMRISLRRPQRARSAIKHALRSVARNDLTIESREQLPG